MEARGQETGRSIVDGIHPEDGTKMSQSPATERVYSVKSADELRRENETLRERISRLNSAILRISASLDVDTVLQEIADNARALTDARYAVITTIDDVGQLEDFVMSGFTREEERQLADWSDNMKIFEQLRDLPSPVRVSDMPGYVRTLGFSTEGVIIRTFQGAPMRHRGVQVGNFFLGEKEGGRAFTDEDEEVLVLFASQAATAIANARTHRAEQQARSDLAALIDTSPVGVVVFDARTGHPISFNREAKRIVGGLLSSGQRTEDLMKVMTCRFSDGREIALHELLLTEVLENAETVRAEEVALSVPDGRQVTTLVNATAIRSAEGAVESVVATMQDLAPLEELERLRAEFLGMVSHELRAPLTSIKGSTATVLGARVLDPAEVRQFFRIIDEQADRMHGLISDLLDAGRIETGTLSVVPIPAEVATLVDQARNTFLSGGGRHTLQIDLPPDLPRVMADERRIVQVMNNLLSNAAMHSPESSRIRVDAQRDGVHVAISVTDEGRGVPPEVLPHLFQKHVSGGKGQPGIRGAGLGLAICKGLVEAHGGRIRATSGDPGQGTRFTFTVPVVDEAVDEAKGTVRNRAGSRRDRGEKPRILVVDDDPQTLRYVRDALAAVGYVPLVTGDPRELSQLIRRKQPDLVLLDLMLPETDGIELMEHVPEMADLPVIFISGYRRDETIARAFELGAADYIAKPFSPTELTARVGAALRRRMEPATFVLDELAIHYEQRRVTVAGRLVTLTATEYELLRVLSLNAGQVVKYDSLLRQVWGRPASGDSEVVRSFVKNLRRKLGDGAASPAYVVTERGVGYRMPAPGDF